MKRSDKKSPRVILLGFDAATWDVIDSMIQQGELPNFQKVLRQGARANLHSLESPVSPRVWTSIVTGKTEHKHGVMDFYSNRSHLKCKRLWDILGEQGQSSSILYWFVTWPPQKEIRGHMVPGFLAMDAQTVPEELNFLKELEISEKGKIVEEQKGEGPLHQIGLVWRALRHGVRPSTLLKAAAFKLEQKFKPYVELDVFWKLQFLKLYLYRDVFKHLIKKEPTDFAAILFPQADQIGHKYWAYYQPDEYERRVGIAVSEEERRKYGQVIPNVYREMDRLVGDIHGMMGDDDILMIVSDHGFGMIEEPRVQLKIKNAEFFDALGLEDSVLGFSIGPDFIVKHKQADNHAGLQHLAERFRQIRLVGEQEPFFDVKTRGSEIVLGLNNVWVLAMNDARDLLQKELQINGKSVPVSRVVAHRADISGDHQPVGILIMTGKHLKQNAQLTDSSVLDIAPTILYAKGLPVARDMDGRPLVEAFDEAYVTQHPVQYVETYDGQETSASEEELDFKMSNELEERLRGLGYLG